MKLHVKKGDTVKVLAGDDRGKTGKVLRAFPKEGTVIVEGIHMAKKHQRARRQQQKGQIIEKATPIDISNVARVTKK